jgi:hypothetical protein
LGLIDEAEKHIRDGYLEAGGLHPDVAPLRLLKIAE